MGLRIAFFGLPLAACLLAGDGHDIAVAARILAEEYRAEQASTWEFLRTANSAARDFYLANEHDHGVFFAYRSVDREGRFQTQAAFKGSYEIGAAVWALSLAAHSATADTLTVLRSYFDRLVDCVARAPANGGFYDAPTGGWIRALLFSPAGWSGFQPRDRKYSLHMLEGCLESERLESSPALRPLVRADLTALLGDLRADGSIERLPDGFGNAEYEYGLALSVLSLGAELYRQGDPTFSRDLGNAALLVLEYAARTFAPRSDEDHAMLLLGLGRVAACVSAPGTPADYPEPEVAAAGTPLSLRVWPNPTRAGVALEWLAPNPEQATVTVLDTTGRVRARFALAAGASAIRHLDWNGSDAAGRRLPVGSYQLSVRSRSGQATSRLVVVR